MYDQLTAYEEVPENLHYITRFIDGLKPAVCIQKPTDLEDAYELALLHEELGDSTSYSQPSSSVRRPAAFPLPPPPPPLVRGRPAEEKKPSDPSRAMPVRTNGRPCGIIGKLKSSVMFVVKSGLVIINANK